MAFLYWRPHSNACVTAPRCRYDDELRRECSARLVWDADVDAVLREKEGAAAAAGAALAALCTGGRPALDDVRALLRARVVSRSWPPPWARERATAGFSAGRDLLAVGLRCVYSPWSPSHWDALMELVDFAGAAGSAASHPMLLDAASPVPLGCTDWREARAAVLEARRDVRLSAERAARRCDFGLASDVPLRSAAAALRARAAGARVPAGALALSLASPPGVDLAAWPVVLLGWRCLNLGGVPRWLRLEAR